MKKLIILFASLLVVSCTKELVEEEILDITIIPDEINQDDFNPPNTQCTFLPIPVKNYNVSSYFTFDIFHPEYNNNIVDQYNYGSSYISVDYNNDGYLDIVGSKIDFSDFRDREDSYTGYERKSPIKFFLGDCNGNFTEDFVNSGKFLGLVHPRKILLGDFNNDSFVDLFFIGHGYDRAPYPGEFNKALFSSSDGTYTEVDYSEIESFFHGGASGDIDNDGDLDVVVVDAGRGKNTIFINNNGVLTPSTSMLDQSLFEGMFIAELVDINKDGFLDIIIGGHDWKYGSNSYNNPPKVIYGSSNLYLESSVTVLPETSIEGQGVVTNFEILDIDGDGTNEIIVVRTGDGKDNQSNFYEGWSIQVLKLQNSSFVDSTSEFIDSYSGTERWITWTKVKDIDNNNRLDLITSGTPETGNFIRWEIINGKFVRK